MFERFTREARAVVLRAEAEARALGADTVAAEHLLLALTDDPAMTACGVGHADVLEALDREQERALAAVGVDAADFDAPPRPASAKRPAFGASAKLALERALQVAVRRGDRQIVAAHVLLGVLAAEVGAVPRALRAGDIDAASLIAAAEASLADRLRRP